MPIVVEYRYNLRHKFDAEQGYRKVQIYLLRVLVMRVGFVSLIVRLLRMMEMSCRRWYGSNYLYERFRVAAKSSKSEIQPILNAACTPAWNDWV